MRYRYGAFHGGPDPLAEPVDAGAAVDALADRILDGSSVREALRDLLRRGMDGARGLDDLMALSDNDLLDLLLARKEPEGELDRPEVRDVLAQLRQPG